MCVLECVWCVHAICACVCERERDVTYCFLTFTGNLIHVSTNLTENDSLGRKTRFTCQSKQNAVRSQGEGKGGEAVYNLRYK